MCGNMRTAEKMQDKVQIFEIASTEIKRKFDNI